MKYTKKGVFIAVLVLLAIAIKMYAASAFRVENGYSNQFYPIFGTFLRYIFGWLPFSIGDIFYGSIIIWLLWALAKGIKNIFKKNITKSGCIKRVVNFVLICLCVYVVFNLFWGINYNRQGIAKQIGVQSDTAVSYQDVKQITFLLATQTNLAKQILMAKKTTYPSNKAMFAMVNQAYKTIADSLVFLQYKPVSLKASMWGWLGNYTGFTGYYNPFSGEAQVNTTVPKFLQPFVACHEVAHQLGYAKENEANFVAYITAINSKNDLLIYSTYFDMFNYAKNRYLFQSFINKDTSAFKELSNTLLPEVKQDIKAVNIFNSRHTNPIEPFIRQGYGFYLKNNNQPMGVKTYDEVIAFLIAYYKKFGKI